MGNTCSCVRKQNETGDDLKTPKKKLKFGTNEDIQNDIVQIDVGIVESAAPNNEAPVKRYRKVILLKPAPTNFTTLTPVSPQVVEKLSNPLNKSKFVRYDPDKQTKPNDMYIPQTVDQVARDVARGEARPACWKDLYWALVGCRNFTKDEARVKSIFSWLCSIPIDQEIFVNLEELEQAVKDGVEYAAESKKVRVVEPSPDSPEVVINNLCRKKSTYLRAFETLCRYSGIPLCRIKGLAKGVDYVVGMKLMENQLPPPVGENSSISRIQHAWSAAYVDERWALFDPMWAAERLAMNAHARMSQVATDEFMVYETDMFYFSADPTVFVHSHFPFEQDWQLLEPPVPLERFESMVQLKPAFYIHGLGLYSHQDGVISVKDKLILKLSLPLSLASILSFTFNLRYNSRDEVIGGINLSRFGMHEVTASTATFNFRFPKNGSYKLTIYARKAGDSVFTDVCEYRVDARPDEGSETCKPGEVKMVPFPPTAQTNYGPQEKASELKLRTLPSDLNAVRRCNGGVFEVRFTTEAPTDKMPRITARLKSLLHESAMLTDCILIRNTHEVPPASIRSSRSTVTSTLGPAKHMCIVTAFLPSAGEYALEVYGMDADAGENGSYFLVWQFMIDATIGYQLSSPVRKGLATTTLGPKDSTWDELRLKTVSHPDPFIHVPTKGAVGLKKVTNKTELMEHFKTQTEMFISERQGTSIEPKAETLNVPELNESSFKPVFVDEPPEPRSCDLQIVFEKPTDENLCIVGQLVDISEPEEDADRTSYLLQVLDGADEQSGEYVSISAGMERITYMIRIPKDNHFYKFYLYATRTDGDLSRSLPLVYTYLLEAPARMMATEVPYIGVKYGPFPEKLESLAKKTEQTG